MDKSPETRPNNNSVNRREIDLVLMAKAVWKKSGWFFSHGNRRWDYICRDKAFY